jgi:hypothetical protein
VLCAALRECRALTHLKLHLHPDDGTTRRVGTPLLNAVATLPALAALDLGGSYMQNATAFGRALGAFLRKNLPSLRVLLVWDCQLGDEGLAPLLDGLAANTDAPE